MIFSKVAFISLIGLATAAIPTPPTTTIIDPYSASLNGYPASLLFNSTVTNIVTATSVFSTTTTSFSSFCPTTRTSHHTSHHSKTSHHTRHSKTSRCPTHHHRPHHHKKCCTKTYTTWIHNKPCCLIVHPCPTNSTCMITSTSYVSSASVTVAPTSAAVAHTTAAVEVAPIQAVAPVCTPCTNYVTRTVRPSLVCTTMVFCDVADQSENCRRQEAQKIEDMVSAALRDGGQVFVNGELVVFESNNNTEVNVVSGTSIVTVTGQNANAAADHAATGMTFVGGAVMLAAAFLFA